MFDTLSTEAFASQLNDPFAKEAEKIFEYIIEYTKSHKELFKHPTTFFRNRDMRQAYEKLDKLVKDRFGFTCKHVSGPMVYAVYTAPPVNYNVFSTNIETIFKRIGVGLGKVTPTDVAEVTKDSVLDYSDIKDAFEDEKSLTYWVYVSMKNLNDKLNTDGIKIDRKKAKVIGLPKDYIIFLMTNPVALIEIYEATASEMTAALIHEIGHVMGQLEASYRTTIANVNIIETIRDEVSKGSDSRKILELVYKTNLGGGEDINSMGSIKAYLTVMDDYARKVKSLANASRDTTTDFEIAADMFASKFGYGEPVATLLDKLQTSLSITYNTPIETIFYAVIAVYYIAFLVIIMGPEILAILFIYAIIIVIASLLGNFLGNLINAKVYVDDNDYRNTDTFDEHLFKRYSSIRNSLVNTIRTSDLPKPVMKKFVADVKVLDDIIDKFNGRTGAFKIFKNIDIFKSKDQIVEEFDHLIESLMENNLHVAVARMKTL